MKKSGFNKNYQKLGIDENIISVFEDGHRIKVGFGKYEWWYFDAKLEDGSSLVIVFYPVPMMNFNFSYKPYVSFDLTRTNGESIHTNYYPKNDDYYFSKETCDIKIGNCTLKGDLNEYQIYYKDKLVEAKIKLKRNVQSWRPGSGIISFGKKDYFAWLPSVPEGDLVLEFTSNNKTELIKGTGYHDHNWGNIPMFNLMHHWYWGRGKVGPYTIVCSYITANKKYNYNEFPIFMISKDNKIVADNSEKYLEFKEEDYIYDEFTEKHFAKKLIYDYKDPNNHYKITFVMEESIEKTSMKQILTKFQYFLIKMMGLRGSYHRVGGTVTLEKIENDQVIEKVSSKGIWEQMYFGKDKIRK